MKDFVVRGLSGSDFRKLQKRKEDDGFGRGLRLDPGREHDLQWGGSLDRFLLSLDDATDISVNISKHFTDVELLGLQQLMYSQDFDRLRRFAAEKGMPIVEIQAPPAPVEIVGAGR